jgi:hypothetical protein
MADSNPATIIFRRNIARPVRPSPDLARLRLSTLPSLISHDRNIDVLPSFRWLKRPDFG